MEVHNNAYDFPLHLFMVNETFTELRAQYAAAADTNVISPYGGSGGDDAAAAAATPDNDYNNDAENGGGGGEYFDNYHDLSGGNEKLVIASAPKHLQNCREELNNCKRINRERLCKLDYYKTYCCLTCHGYY